MKDKLAPYKYPRQIVFVTDLPKTATGKIQRFKLRELRSCRAMKSSCAFVDIDWRGRTVRIEHAWHRAERARARRCWCSCTKAWARCRCGGLPAAPVRRRRLRGLVYSRPGYGRSTPRAAEEAWDLDFMHRQAHEVLPALLAALDIDASPRKPWLFGHSDGGSIALLYAARVPAARRRRHRLAPHILVEDLSVASIAKARDGLRDHRPAPAPGALPRRPRLGLLGLERHLAAPAVPPLVDRGRARRHPLPAAGRAGPGRRVRHAGADPRHRAARAADRAARTAGVRPFAAPRPARSAHRGRRPDSFARTTTPGDNP